MLNTTARQNTTPRTVLVVEDEPTLATAIAQRITAEGWTARVAGDGASAVQAASQLRPDLVIMDIMLPVMDGLEATKRIVAERPVPVLILTARDDEADKVIGLGAGADDYMTKPFSMRELIARCKALLRRVERAKVIAKNSENEKLLDFGSMVIDPAQRIVTVNGEQVHLTPTEFDLLATLARRPKSVLTREKLLEEVWDWVDASGTRTVDSHVKAPYARCRYHPHRAWRGLRFRAADRVMASKKQQQSRLDAMKPRVKPVDLFSSLKLELSALIVIATAIAFAMCWFLLKFGWSGWIAMPLTLVVALGITYFFSRGITAPLRQMRDVAEAMADGDYTVRVDIDQDRHDEVGKLARSFNEMAGELEHADKMRRDMIANVSHELRTPVSALQAMVENMADGVTEPTPTNLESILTQTQRLSDLIAFLLDLSRMEAGAASLNIEKFNFADFLDETIEPLEIADGGHAHDIRVTVPADITMEGDQDRLRQLFTNIIANALKHSADGTTVLVDAHEDENQGTIVTNVVNFGSQIAPSDRLDIFRRFVKGKTGPGTESGGTGLGLSIARWAAQLHGGTVKVVDDTRGADFEIILPKYHIAER